MRRLIIALLLIVQAHIGVCQYYNAQAPLPQIEQDGFYRIILTPALAVYLSDNFNNVRILDNKEQEVPYLFNTEAISKTSLIFNEYLIEEKKEIKDSCTVLILNNPSTNAINNINVLIRNAEVTKEAVLSASDDMVTWYALKEKFFISNINNANGTSEISIVDFPLSNYRYYRVWINDKKSAPLNIIKAGYYSTQTGEAQYLSVPVTKQTQSDSTKEKKTYVRISFDTLRLIDKITWSASGSPYYLRSGSLYAEREKINKKGKTEKYLEYLSSLQLSSRGENMITLPGIKVRNLLMVIENNDNPPLRIDSIRPYQLNRYITALLKKDNTYVLKFGDQTFKEPVYDIAYFMDSIPSQPTILKAGVIEAITKGDQPPAATTIFTNKLIIWIALIVIIVLLGFMSIRMVRETNATQKPNQL